MKLHRDIIIGLSYIAIGLLSLTFLFYIILTPTLEELILALKFIGLLSAFFGALTLIVIGTEKLVVT